MEDSELPAPETEKKILSPYEDLALEEVWRRYVGIDSPPAGFLEAMYAETQRLIHEERESTEAPQLQELEFEGEEKENTFGEFENRFVTPRPGPTLIVGSKLYEGREDRRLRYDRAVGVDMLDGEGVDVVFNLERDFPKKMPKKLDQRFAHVECLSVLEHSKKPWKVAENISRLMMPGATIFLSAPFIWRVHGYPDDYFRFTKSGIKALFEDSIDWVVLAYASTKLKRNDMVPSFTLKDYPYFPKTEVLGFGLRRY